MTQHSATPPRTPRSHPEDQIMTSPTTPSSEDVGPPQQSGPDGLDRREFLTRGAGFMAWTSMGGVGAAGLDALFPSAAGAQQAKTGYRALVCFFLAGGNDSFNMVVPMSGGQPHPHYTTVRSGINLGAGDLLNLNVASQAESEYSEFAMHKSLSFVADRFNAGEAAVIANVGTIHPDVGANPNSGSRPMALYSHNSQIGTWQTAQVAQPGVATGWVGRLGDQMSNTSDGGANEFKFISMSGNNVLQLGDGEGSGFGPNSSRAQSINYVITPAGALSLREPVFGRNPYRSVLDDLVNNPTRTRFGGLYQETVASSLGLGDKFTGAFRDKLRDEDANLEGLASVSAGVAQSIRAARDNANQLGLPCRQVYFIMHGGYDHHQEVINAHRNRLADLNAGLSRLWTQLDNDGALDDVVMFSSSEFGRTLVGNGRGSDHGWGGHSFAIARKPLKGTSTAAAGAPGGRIVGVYPKIKSAPDFDGDMSYDNFARGRVKPTTAIEEYFAELAMWLGVHHSDALSHILPNLEKFWKLGHVPMGFLDCAEVFAAGNIVDGQPDLAACVEALGKPTIDLFSVGDPSADGIRVQSLGKNCFKGTASQNASAYLFWPGQQIPEGFTTVTVTTNAPTGCRYSVFTSARDSTYAPAPVYFSPRPDLGPGWKNVRLVFADPFSSVHGLGLDVPEDFDGEFCVSNVHVGDGPLPASTVTNAPDPVVSPEPVVSPDPVVSPEPTGSIGESEIDLLKVIGTTVASGETETSADGLTYTVGQAIQASSYHLVQMNPFLPFDPTVRTKLSVVAKMPEPKFIRFKRQAGSIDLVLARTVDLAGGFQRFEFDLAPGLNTVRSFYIFVDRQSHLGETITLQSVWLG